MPTRPTAKGADPKGIHNSSPSGDPAYWAQEKDKHPEPILQLGKGGQSLSEATRLP